MQERASEAAVQVDRASAAEDQASEKGRGLGWDLVWAAQQGARLRADRAFRP
jgi:hypothetical protein